MGIKGISSSSFMSDANIISSLLSDSDHNTHPFASRPAGTSEWRCGLGWGGRKREERERGERKRRKRERDREKRGYEPFLLHAPPYTGLYIRGEIKLTSTGSFDGFGSHHTRKS
jgi:hypothetical protein